MSRSTRYTPWTRLTHGCELRWFFCFARLFSIEGLHVGKVFYGNYYDTSVTSGRQCHDYPLFVNLGILVGRIVAAVHRELQHHKAVLEQHLADLGILSPIFGCFGRQSEHYNHPHGFWPSEKSQNGTRTPTSAIFALFSNHGTQKAPSAIIEN